MVECIEILVTTDPTLDFTKIKELADYGTKAASIAGFAAAIIAPNESKI